MCELNRNSSVPQSQKDINFQVSPEERKKNQKCIQKRPESHIYNGEPDSAE